MTDTAPQPMVPMHGLTEALHLGEDDTPWVYAGDLGIKLLHVDLNQGLWILRNRFPAGYRVQRHYHTGPVYALTLAGSWGYEEYPEYLNRPGSYLYEPAHSVHTLVVPEDNDGETDVWFAIHGADEHATNPIRRLAPHAAIRDPPSDRASTCAAAATHEPTVTSFLNRAARRAIEETDAASASRERARPTSEARRWHRVPPPRPRSRAR